MNLRSNIPQAILTAALAFSAAQSARGDESVDDFTGGGDATDCDPWCWNPLWCCLGTFTATEEGLEVRNTTTIDTVLVSADVFSGELSIRMLASFNSTVNKQDPEGDYPTLSIGVHFDTGINGYYLFAQQNGEVHLWKWRSQEYVELRAGHAGRDFFVGDVELELTSLQEPSGDQRLEGRAWHHGEVRPQEPQVALVDAEFQSGAAVFGGNVVEGNPIVVRSVTIRTPPYTTPFRRGDANADGRTDISDGIFILGHLFLGGGAPTCVDAADADDNGALEITDAVFLFSHLFLGGPPPSAPGPLACGEDPRDDELGCEVYAPPCM